MRRRAATAALILGALLAGPVGSAHAVDPSAIWGQDFEEQLPGSIPKGWRPAWGVRGDDQLVVSNLRALSGSRSLLLDRWSGAEAAQWGMHTQLPPVQDGWAVLSWGFLVQGAGNDAWFSFEVRGSGTNERIANVGVFDGIVNLASADWKTRLPLGRYEADGWYRVVLRLPTQGGGQGEARAMLYRQVRGGEWLPVGEERTVAAVPPRERYHSFMLVTATGKRGYLLFLDDIQVEKRRR